MKITMSLLVVFIWLLTIFDTHGQQITFGTLPKVNDTLEIRTDMLPDQLDYDKTGDNVFWDFRSLSAPYIFQTVVRPVTYGQAAGSFKNAQGVILYPEGYEMYTVHGNDQFSIAGYNNYDFMDLDLSYPSYYQVPYPIQRKEYRLGDREEETYSLYMPIKNEDIPTDILRELPYTPDSARFVLNTQLTSSIEAYGRLDLLVDRYTVVRESITEVLDKKLEIKNASIPWQDVSDLFEGNNLFNNEIIKKERFWSIKSAVPVAELILDSGDNKIKQVRFASHPYLVNEVKIASLKRDIFAYPNPTLGMTRFDLNNLSSGFYTLEISNLLSKSVWSEEYFVDKNKTVKVDLSHLKKGTYFYRIVNERGEIIVTKRLIVLKP